MKALRVHLQILCLLAAFGAASGVRADAAATLAPGQRAARAAPPESAVAQLVDEGVAALGRGDAAAARKALRRAVELDAENVTAHTYLGVIADQSGDLAEAERHFAAAAIAAPLLASARNNHGAILLRLGRTAQAASQFETSLKLDRNQPSALVNLAQIRFAGGDPAGLRAAFDLFERAQRIAPDAEVARALVVTALRLGEREAAARHFRDYFAATPDPSSGIQAPAARAELGAALLEAGLAGEAAQELGAAVALDASNAASIILLARAHLARREVREAGRALEAAVARGVNSGPLYAALADVYEVSGHAENAIPAMRLAIEQEPGNELYRFRYGMLLTDSRAPKAAVIRLNEALEKFPRSSRLWFALGVAHFTDRMLKEAADAFARAAELDPRFAPALAYLGMTFAEQGLFTEALPYYEQALAADENLAAAAAAHYLLADALLKQAAPDDARAAGHLARAAELDPTFAPARLALAKILLGANRLEEAARHLEQVAATNPEMAEAQYQLGRVYQRLKRTAEAQAAFANFKRLSDTQKQQAETDRREVVRRLANVRF